MLSLIQSQDFYKLRFWWSPKLGIKVIYSRCNFLGYEVKMVHLLTGLSLSSDMYIIIFQCSSCCTESEKNCLTSVGFKEKCQKTIDHQINSSFTCLKCRDPNVNTVPISLSFFKIPPIFILEVEHLTNSIPMNNIEEHIHIIHTKIGLKYVLIRFTIHAGLRR